MVISGIPNHYVPASVHARAVMQIGGLTDSKVEIFGLTITVISSLNSGVLRNV